MCETQHAIKYVRRKIHKLYFDKSPSATQVCQWSRECASGTFLAVSNGQYSVYALGRLQTVPMAAMTHMDAIKSNNHTDEHTCRLNRLKRRKLHVGVHRDAVQPASLLGT